MGWFSNIISKIGDFVRPVIGKIADAGKWITSKVGDGINYVRKGLDYASNIPIVGEALQAAQNTPTGQMLMGGLDKIEEYNNQARNIINSNQVQRLINPNG